MDANVGLISGDDDATAVLVVSFTHNQSCLFRIPLDVRLPKASSSRIVSCFHDLATQDEGESFPDKEEMRKAIRYMVGSVLSQCSLHPSMKLPDAVIEVYETRTGSIQWRICHESSYIQYLQALLPLDHLSSVKDRPFIIPKPIHYSSMIPIQMLGGRGGSMLVRIAREPAALYVYKGLKFSMFLESGEDFPHERDAFYSELQIAPPKYTVLADTVIADSQTRICGMLQEHMRNDSLQSVLDNSLLTNTRLPLGDKARWCYQMASALSHAHLTAGTFHMDLKPSNFLLNDQRDLVLTDWEQCGASPSFPAPEADGSWDAEEVPQPQPASSASKETKPSLAYSRYQGPTRENLWSWPKWNVFPIWRDTCPRALLAAE